MKIIFPFIVIIQLLFVCQRIQSYIQEQSRLRLNTILSETMFKKVYWISNSLILNINGLTYSLNVKLLKDLILLRKIWTCILCIISACFWMGIQVLKLIRRYNPSDFLHWDSKESKLIMTSTYELQSLDSLLLIEQKWKRWKLLYVTYVPLMFWATLRFSNVV